MQLIYAGRGENIEFEQLQQGSTNMDRDGTGNLTVQVRLHDSIVGRGVENVSIRIVSTKPPTRHFEAPATFTEKTSFRGDALFKDIPLGQYDVYVEADSYTRKTARAIVRIPGPDPQGHFVRPNNVIGVKLDKGEVGENFSLESGVKLSVDITKKVKKIADAYYLLTKKKLVVTSGIRSAQSQAEAMYAKLVGGDSLSIYVDQTAAKKIKEIYERGVKEKKEKEALVKEMKEEIEKQIGKGVYLSKHLKKGAVDIRSRDMTSSEKEAFKKAAKDVADSVILETIPPHFHLQL